jgi:hypothetical protein
MADKPFLSYALKQNFTTADWRLINTLVKGAIVSYTEIIGEAGGSAVLYSEQNTKAGFRPKRLDPSRRMPISRKDQTFKDIIRVSSAPDSIGYFRLTRRRSTMDYAATGKPCRFLALSILKLIEEEFPGSVVWRSCNATSEDWRIASQIVESVNGPGSVAVPDAVDSDLDISPPDYMDFRA